MKPHTPSLTLAALLAAAPAVAQDAFVVEPPLGEQALAYTFHNATATTLPLSGAETLPPDGWYADGYARSSLLRDGEEDIIRVRLSGPATLEVQTFDPAGPCEIDTVAELHAWDADLGLWMKLLAADDRGFGPCASFEADVSPGDYAVRIYEAARGPIARYAFDVAARYEIARGQEMLGGFAADGRDRFTLVGDDLPDALVMCTGDGGFGCPGDTTLTITDVDSGVEWFDDDGGAGYCSCLTVPADGTYRVDVSGYGGQAVEEYVLSVY